MNYALRAIKSAQGEETPCFSATITLDGVDIGSVRNTGTGGNCFWYWKDHLVGETFYRWIKANTTESFEPEDDWAYQHLDAFDNLKIYMRKSLKKTLFAIDADISTGEYRELSTPDSLKARAWILAKYTAQHPKVFDRTTKTWVAITPIAVKAAA
jgi:hypothetical protein